MIEELQTHILKNQEDVWREISPQHEDALEGEESAEELVESIEDDPKWSFEVAQDLAGLLAHYAVNPNLEIEQYDVTVLDDPWEKRKHEMVEIRDSDKFQHDIEELRNLFGEVVELNRLISESLGRARDELKDSYGITDLEVDEVKKMSDLEEPDIVLEYDQMGGNSSSVR